MKSYKQFLIEYKMQHTAPTLEDDPAGHELDMVMPDIYGPKAKRFHGTGSRFDNKAFDVIQKMKGKPNAKVTIYRAVPENIDTINPGDWVSITKEYAIQHIAGDEGYKVISKDVKAKEIANDGNSIHEFGYDPS